MLCSRLSSSPCFSAALKIRVTTFKSSMNITSAYQFEKSHPGATVELSEEYWIWRRYNYDKQTNLIGYYRRFMD